MKEGKKVCLRALRDEDMMVLFKWINDPELIKFTNTFKPISASEQRKWFESLPLRKDQIVLGIESRNKKRLIGTCGLYSIEWQNRKAEVRIKIGEKSYWGKGYGKDAMKLLIDFAFGDINLRRLWLRVLKTNTRAIQLYFDAGFRKEGVLKKDIYIQGKYCDVVIMGLFSMY